MGNSIKAIKDGNLIDGTGKPPIENAVVVIKDSRILEAGGSDVRIQSSAQIIGTDGMTIAPGFMDTHVHLGCVEAPATQAVKHAREMIEAGFTTVRDVGIIHISSTPWGEFTPLVS